MLTHGASKIYNLHFPHEPTSADFGPWITIRMLNRPSQRERVIPLSEHVRSLKESSDKVGQPATQLGGKFDCVSVYGEFLRGGIVEHVSR